MPDDPNRAEFVNGVPAALIVSAVRAAIAAGDEIAISANLRDGGLSIRCARGPVSPSLNGHEPAQPRRQRRGGARAKHRLPDEFLRMVEEAGYASVSALAVASGHPNALRDYARGRARSMRADVLSAVASRLNRSMEEVQTALGMPRRGAP